MLSDNITKLRKIKGLTQEELAIRLHVVRQTVSKWEKGLSVPDSELLMRLAEILEVSVSDLLGADFSPEPEQNAVADQLARINEQLAIKNRRARRIWKIVGIILAAFLLVEAVLVILNLSLYSHSTAKKVELQTQVEVAAPSS